MHQKYKLLTHCLRLNLGMTFFRLTALQTQSFLTLCVTLAMAASRLTEQTVRDNIARLKHFPTCCAYYMPLASRTSFDVQDIYEHFVTASRRDDRYLSNSASVAPRGF